jgi:hypothetical protein
MDQVTRRAFGLAGAAVGSAALQIGAQTARALPLVCVFSKPLIKIHYEDLGGVLKDLGAVGCDLTVRPGGHVEPALAPADLYRAIEAIRAEGVEVPMLTTAFVSAADPTLRSVLAIAGAARMKVPYFKLGYWQYRPADDIKARIGEVRRDVAGLVAQARAYGMVAGFHNHSGNYVGEAVWDGRAVMDGHGCELDRLLFRPLPCHRGGRRSRLESIAHADGAAAHQDGGAEGLSIGRRRAASGARGCARWAKAWSNWPQRVRLVGLRRGITGPLSVHLEYEPADMCRRPLPAIWQFVNGSRWPPCVGCSRAESAWYNGEICPPSAWKRRLRGYDVSGGARHPGTHVAQYVPVARPGRCSWCPPRTCGATSARVWSTGLKPRIPHEVLFLPGGEDQQAPGAGGTVGRADGASWARTAAA